jgi:hypothetical protein
MKRPFLGALFAAFVCVPLQALALKPVIQVGVGGGAVLVGGGGPGGGGFDPETFAPPNAPKTLVVTGRSADSLTTVWYDRSNFEDGYRVLRQSEGTWVLVAETPPGSGFMSYEDNSALLPDTRYCYLVRPYNGNGQSSSPVSCGYTRDGNDNTVWRAELIVRTGDVDDAGTDDSVFVLLNSAAGNTQPGGNRTWLDYARDDFERGANHTYDLGLGSVGELGDITQITIGKTGDDGWCVRDFTLKVNGFDLYTQDLSASAQGCLWLDTEGGHATTFSVDHATLRASPPWANYNEDAALLLLAFRGIPNEEVVSRIEGIVGDSVHGESLYWGHLHGAGVEASRGCPATAPTCNSIHVDLDLAADVNNAPDPEVDVDFDLKFECTGGAITITTENVVIDADSSWFWEVLSFGVMNLVDGEVEDKVQDAWQNISQTFNGVADCSASVDAGGNVTFTVATPSAPTSPVARPSAVVSTMTMKR